MSNLINANIITPFSSPSFTAIWPYNNTLPTKLLIMLTNLATNNKLTTIHCIILVLKTLSSRKVNLPLCYHSLLFSNTKQTLKCDNLKRSLLAHKLFILPHSKPN